MMESLLLVLAVAVVVLLVAAIYLFARYNSLLARTNETAWQQFEGWRRAELASIRQQLARAARAEAEALVETARAEAELAASETARAELERWRQSELADARGDAITAAKAEAQLDLERWRADAEQGIRDDAVRRSVAVVSGKVTEHLAPYMAAFPYNARDARFLGTPIDLIVFDGLDDGEIRQVVFVEVKTGSSASLSSRERSVRDAVLDRRVAWREFRVESTGEPVPPEERPVRRRRRSHPPSSDDALAGRPYPTFRERVARVQAERHGSLHGRGVCERCGDKLIEGARFCQGCGAACS